MEAVVRGARAESGNITYALYQSVDSPDRFMRLEDLGLPYFIPSAARDLGSDGARRSRSLAPLGMKEGPPGSPGT